MVIHFLQGRRPPVVPVLQDMTAGPLRGRNKKKVMVSGYDTYFYQNLDDKRLTEFGAKNTENVGTLLFEFFLFYGFYFQYKDKVCFGEGKKNYSYYSYFFFFKKKKNKNTCFLRSFLRELAEL